MWLNVLMTLVAARGVEVQATSPLERGGIGPSMAVPELPVRFEVPDAEGSDTGRARYCCISDAGCGEETACAPGSTRIPCPCPL